MSVTFIKKIDPLGFDFILWQYVSVKILLYKYDQMW